VPCDAEVVYRTNFVEPPPADVRNVLVVKEQVIRTNFELRSTSGK
jgi:hypothetical protein